MWYTILAVGMVILIFVFIFKNKNDMTIYEQIRDKMFARRQSDTNNTSIV